MVDLRQRTFAGGRLADAPLTILVVDDDPDMRVYVRQCLDLLDVRFLQVLEAGDGIEALSMARRLPLDLVISDVIMPRMDGYELCRAIKALPSPVSVVLISGESDDRRNLNAGVDAFLGKPFNAERLRRTLADVLSESR